MSATSGRGFRSRTLWVTGAGSGVGRAVAVIAANAGFDVALSGRRLDALQATRELIAPTGVRTAIATVDVTDTASVASAHASVLRDLGPVTDLVLAAGLNVRERSWNRISDESFKDIVDTNLLGPAYAVRHTLPDMRSEGRGTIVVISSYAGWRFGEGAGAAYSSSKAGLEGIVASINFEEAKAGIRATLVCPGSIDTEFVNQRSVVPDAGARRRMLSPEDVARTVQMALEFPAHLRIDELVISPLAND